MSPQSLSRHTRSAPQWRHLLAAFFTRSAQAGHFFVDARPTAKPAAPNSGATRRSMAPSTAALDPPGACKSCQAITNAAHASPYRTRCMFFSLSTV